MTRDEAVAALHEIEQLTLWHDLPEATRAILRDLADRLERGNPSQATMPTSAATIIRAGTGGVMFSSSTYRIVFAAIPRHPPGNPPKPWRFDS